MGNKIIFCLLIFMVSIFSGISFAAENPFQGLSKEQIINKFFDSRPLDTIEGIWLDGELRQWIAIKSNLVDSSKKYGDHDYLMVEYAPSQKDVYIDGVGKTQYNSCFKFKKQYLRFLNQNALYYFNNRALAGNQYSSVYTRIYPSEEK